MTSQIKKIKKGRSNGQSTYASVRRARFRTPALTLPREREKKKEEKSYVARTNVLLKPRKRGVVYFPTIRIRARGVGPIASWSLHSVFPL